MAEESDCGLPFWAVLEIMGHRRLGGYLREVQIAGMGFVRIDIPAQGEHAAATQFYPPSSIYAITPVMEEMARAVARSSRPEPVSRWELPPAAESSISQRLTADESVTQRVARRCQERAAREAGYDTEYDPDDWREEEDLELDEEDDRQRELDDEVRGIERGAITLGDPFADL